MYALTVRDTDGNDVVKYCGVSRDQPIHVLHKDVPQQDWNSLYDFVEWVMENHRQWKIYSKTFTTEIRKGKIKFSQSQ